MTKELNLPVEEKDYERLKIIAKNKKTTIKNYVKNVFKKAFPDENETCIILKFPKEILANEENFNKWLNQTTISLKNLFKKDHH
jgi:hypothetical protein